MCTPMYILSFHDSCSTNLAIYIISPSTVTIQLKSNTRGKISTKVGYFNIKCYVSPKYLFST